MTTATTARMIAEMTEEMTGCKTGNKVKAAAATARAYSKTPGGMATSGRATAGLVAPAGSGGASNRRKDDRRYRQGNHLPLFRPSTAWGLRSSSSQRPGWGALGGLRLGNRWSVPAGSSRQLSAYRGCCRAETSEKKRTRRRRSQCSSPSSTPTARRSLPSQYCASVPGLSLIMANGPGHSGDNGCHFLAPRRSSIVFASAASVWQLGREHDHEEEKSEDHLRRARAPPHPAVRKQLRLEVVHRLARQASALAHCLVGAGRMGSPSARRPQDGED